MSELSSPESSLEASVTLRDVVSRLDDLVKEVRRQGRAAIAAQAAAEACLEAVQARAAGEAEDDVEDDPDDPAAAWATGFFPVADALDRAVAQASAMAERRLGPKVSGLWALLRREPAGDPELRALAEGLRVLRAQLAGALASCGVTADRRVGVAVDPELHRVVEVRPLRAGEQASTVLEVIRPAYLSGERVLREGEVVSSAPGVPPPTFVAK